LTDFPGHLSGSRGGLLCAEELSAPPLDRWIESASGDGVRNNPEVSPARAAHKEVLPHKNLPHKKGRSESAAALKRSPMSSGVLSQSLFLFR
jgi:hypothetical protein